MHEIINFILLNLFEFKWLKWFTGLDYSLWVSFWFVIIALSMARDYQSSTWKRKLSDDDDLVFGEVCYLIAIRGHTRRDYIKLVSYYRNGYR